jgi:Carboxypeptidase regulatory-like domain/TonB-dependent Receptor Plug Domain
MNKRFSVYLSPRLLCMGMIVVLSCSLLSAQTIISGDIAGNVSDPTGAAVADAMVTLSSLESGATQSVKTDGTGNFRFPLLRPGEYRLEVAAPGFATVTQKVTAAVGQVVSANVKVSVKGTSELVEVTGATPLLQTESANLTASYNPKEIELTPNPGGDLTNYALSTPGVVLSTGGGYGNFTAYGMPGTSNLFTVNGGDMNDPFSNLNNSGSSNNMLGTNEIQELTIVHNGYTGQYGRAAGANMNFTTKSGGNSFHGNAKWDWNGRYLNANEWFNKQAGNDRPFANSNQWGGSFGGPIVKNKLFFFFDSEGLRYVLPGGGTPVYIPTSQFANAVLANVQATQPNEVATYQSMFQLYAGAPGASGAAPNPGDGGCGDLAANGTTTINGVAFGTGGAPCTSTFRSEVNNLNIERLMSIRVDYNIGANDRLNARYWQDRGTQPTFTDPINKAFNALSVQPQDAGQLTETHIFNSHLINQFIVGGFYYGALFGAANLKASEAVFPTEVGGSHNGGNSCTSFDGLLTCMGGEYSRYPAGRNFGQYQAVDDLSYSRGNHEFKFGVNFRRVNFSTYRPGVNQTGVFNVFSMTDFANGTLENGSNVTQQFSAETHYPLNSYSMGVYAQDEWRVNNQLKITASLRVDRNSNLTCLKNCFAKFAGGFNAISHDVDTPYNQSILTGQKQLFDGLERVVWQPRFGFTYSPKGRSTVIRGGAGVFSDLYPAQVTDLLVQNAPTVSVFLVGGPGIPAFGPGGGFDLAAADNAAFHSAFANGGTLNSIKAQIPTFNGPNYYTVVPNFRNPRYAEWNLEVQQAFGEKTVATLGYVGNHGSNLAVQQNGVNAYCKVCPFGTLPTSAPDPRFGRIRQLTNEGISNYNGLTATLVRRLTKGLQGSINYTWSHALDDISNAGFDQYSFNTLGEAFLYQIDPKNLRRYNYGNADYDFRQNLSASYIYEMPSLFKGSRLLNSVVGGWVTSGVIYKRTGQPYSVVDTALTNSLTGNNSAGVVMPYFLGGSMPNCKVDITCLNPAQFTVTGQNTFGNIARNQFRGPGYFDMDMTIKKNFRITESGLTFSMGANAYNVLNHPRFANPDNNFADAGSTFGQIQSTVVPASSPYGNFQGSAVSGRVLQLELEVKF